MSEEDWQVGFVKSVAVFLNGDALRDLDENGVRLSDSSFLMLFNAHHEALPFTMPDASFGERWTVVVDTRSPTGEREVSVAAGESIEVAGRALVVLTRTAEVALQSC